MRLRCRARISATLRELLIAFPVYRTYGTREGLTPPDVALLNRVVASVETSEAALSLIVRILTGDLPEDCRESAALFRTRFQQLTGPLMAKSVEDTLFFRHNLELALNEVGADPTPRAFSLSRFHRRCAFVWPSARRAAGYLHARYQARGRCPGAPLHPDGSPGTLGKIWPAGGR